MNLGNTSERRIVMVSYEWTTSQPSTPKDLRKASRELSDAAQQLIQLSEELLEKSQELRKATQEDAMWEQYRAELNRISQALEEESSKLPSYDEEETSEVQEPFGFSRSDSAPVRDRHLFPTGKDGKTTKDRRYHPTNKKSDKDKTFGKKGVPYSKLKMDTPAQVSREKILEAQKVEGPWPKAK